MEQETLFTASKWNILTALGNDQRSPMELAKILNTSVANVSQQLRLLEMAGLVSSKRISNRDKGQPRVLYSLAGNHFYLIAAAKEFVNKGFFELTARNKAILRIWFLEDPESHYYIEKAFWKLDDHMSKIDAILLDNAANEYTLLVVSQEKLDIKDVKIKNPDKKEKTVRIKTLKPEAFKKLKGDFYQLYDPKGITNDKQTGEDK